MRHGIYRPSLIARTAVLAGLSLLAITYAGVNPAQAQCQTQQDQLATSQSDPRYVRPAASG